MKIYDDKTSNMSVAYGTKMMREHMENNKIHLYDYQKKFLSTGYIYWNRLNKGSNMIEDLCFVVEYLKSKVKSYQKKIDGIASYKYMSNRTKFAKGYYGGRIAEAKEVVKALQDIIDGNTK